MSVRASWSVAVVLVIGLAVVAVSSVCALQATPPPKIDHRGTGTVVSLMPAPSPVHATRPVIVIDHEPIRGLTNERRSMPFVAASSDLLRGLKVGDRVAFGLQETPDGLLLVTIERLAR